MKHLDLFSGIGGFALAARRVGWETLAFCEIDSYCRRVLEKNWPTIPIYEDIREFNGKRWRGAIDVATAGWPCQDISSAGTQSGLQGERSGLWSELNRVLGEVRPRFAVLENVSNLLAGERGRWFGQVLGDLAEIGYDTQWHCIPASAVGAPHQRDRVWIIATDASRERVRLQPGRSGGKSRKGQAVASTHGETQPVADTDSGRLEIGGLQEHGELESETGDQPDRRGEERRWDWPNGGWWATEPGMGRVANGVPARVDRLRGLGNAIVPQVAELIFRSIIK